MNGTGGETLRKKKTKMAFLIRLISVVGQRKQPAGSAPKMSFIGKCKNNLKKSDFKSIYLKYGSKYSMTYLLLKSEEFVSASSGKQRKLRFAAKWRQLVLMTMNLFKPEACDSNEGHEKSFEFKFTTRPLLQFSFLLRHKLSPGFHFLPARRYAILIFRADPFYFGFVFCSFFPGSRYRKT